ncbi:probable ATP-dependent RNA helicase DDX28 [Mycetomoellerius zeteki]|uniref:probable ATP-dependent RNA helicase DDX28 n=1 Tax=Mycetomoellerius zeteki TaxID=64791 RepID=UPI00084E75DC|nr:PREDICTED: probable ATP-dependent RNA helicase DDX28 [Trachymyrmex zeteki]XP_018311231.1 PREDICTED: probable ATP-dependent RNA helicase DDX28 [Trachymyrmex zeteki]
MFSRFYNLYQRTAFIQFTQLQRCYRKSFKKKSYVKRTEAPKDIKGEVPIIVCRRKEFNFYEGQEYSKYKPIPLVSKGWHHYKSKGDYFYIYPLTNVTKEAYSKSFKEKKEEEEEELHDSFKYFGLNPQLIDILKRYSITKPLKIQKIGIPKILNGANTVIAAETGCGKTLTYLLPMIDEVLRWKELVGHRYNTPLGLIVTPTRELAFQIGLEAKKICQYLGIRTKTITGGKTKKMMLDPPVEEVDIVVASFGVISKLTTTKIYKLDMVRHLVLDEADALFHETFEEKLQIFLRKVPLGFVQNPDDNKLPISAQFTLASATMPSRMSEVLEDIINVQSLEHVTSNKLHHILVPQKFIRVGPSDKPTALLKYIKSKVANKEQVIIFNNSNTTCNWVSMFLNNSNIQTVSLNGDMELYDRQNKYASFKSGKSYVLCTTNAGSRGLDTVTVRHVLNYEFPNATADYIHRCGRTGRIGNIKDCRVDNFISTLNDIAVVQKIERAVRKSKPIPIFDIRVPKEEDDVYEPFGSQIETEEKQEFSIPY